MSSKPMTRLRRQLRRWGFEAKKTRGGHWRFEHPDLIVFVCGPGSLWMAVRLEIFLPRFGGS